MQVILDWVLCRMYAELIKIRGGARGEAGEAVNAPSAAARRERVKCCDKREEQ